jgi:hypothetical protein
MTPSSRKRRLQSPRPERRVLLVPTQNMMRREAALWWRDRHNQIRARRVHETGMWLVSADVTGERDDTRIGLGPICAINPAGHVVMQVPIGATSMIGQREIAPAGSVQRNVGGAPERVADRLTTPSTRHR